MLVWCSRAAARALAAENAPSALGFPRRPDGEHLDAHVPAQRRLFRLVNHSHAALADLVAECGSRRSVPVPPRLSAESWTPCVEPSPSWLVAFSIRSIMEKTCRMRSASSGYLHRVFRDAGSFAPAAAVHELVRERTNGIGRKVINGHVSTPHGRRPGEQVLEDL